MQGFVSNIRTSQQSITIFPSFCFSVVQNSVSTIFTAITLFIVGPSLVAAQNCPVSVSTASHCTGVFKLETSHVPMLYMTEGSFAWVAVKYTSSTSDPIVVDRWTSTSKNFYVSLSILKSAIKVAVDILMVESASSVYANTTAGAFTKVRENILGGCGWFKDTHSNNDLTGWMSPYATGNQLPDPRQVDCQNYGCCISAQCKAAFPSCPEPYGCNNYIFNSCNNAQGSHSTLSTHWRMRSGQYESPSTHSIWFRIPLTHLVSASLPPQSVPVSEGLIAMYTADSWRAAESLTSGTWMDLSGAGNHVTEIGGSISVARPVGAPAYIYGDSASWMWFPIGILPSSSYTLIYVARYNGPNRKCIFTADLNWLSGFYCNCYGGLSSCFPITGVKFRYVEGSSHPNNGWATQANIDLHGFDWVTGIDRGDSFRSNGVDRTLVPGNGFSVGGRLGINVGYYSPPYPYCGTSDFAVQHLLVFNRRMTDSEVSRVEAWLAALQPAFTPANLQGVVGFYDSRDLVACSINCSWAPRAGFSGILTGTASISSDGWVMNPRMSTSVNTGITGSQSFTSIVGFKLSSAGDAALRTLAQIGGSSQCRAQLLSAAGLRFSGCVDYPADISFNSAQQTASSHVWAVMHDGGTAARSYLNGAYFTHTTGSWNTANGPLYVGRSGTGAFNDVLPGGVRFVLLFNRALSQSEVAAVARWSWETHGVGLDLMNFSPEAWTGVRERQVYWTPPAHMQPLSSRTVRFVINISSICNACGSNLSGWRSIVRFGAADVDPVPYTDRFMSFYIIDSTRRLYIAMTKSDLSGDVGFYCGTEMVTPSLITVVHTRTSVSTFINSVKQMDACSVSTFPSSVSIADTDCTRAARHSSIGYSTSGFNLRSLQLFDYAMTDLEAQAPVIISVTPQVLLASHSSLTIIGSPFALGVACSALFLDGSTSTNCTVVSAVEIVVAINIATPAVRPSVMVALTHNGTTFRNTPLSLYIGSGLSLSLSKYLSNSAMVVLTLSFKTAVALSSQSFKLISVNGLPFKAFDTNATSTSCSNLSPSNIGIFASFRPSQGVLMLTLATAAIPTSPTAAIVCTVPGFTLGDASLPSTGYDSSLHSSTSMFFEIYEGQTMTLSTSSINVVFDSITFASYGLPSRIQDSTSCSIGHSCVPSIIPSSYFGRGFLNSSSCHADILISVKNALTGQSQAQITCSNQAFGIDPCPELAKRCAIQVSMRCKEMFLIYPKCFLSEVQLSTLDSGGRPLQTQGGVDFPEIVNPRVVTGASPSLHPTTGQMSLSIYGTNAGHSDWSGRLRIGGTASLLTVWRSAHHVTCRTAIGLGSGLSVMASLLLNRGSLSGVFSYSSITLKVSSPEFLSPLTGSVSFTAVGTNFGKTHPSPSLKFSDTSFQSSLWQSSSSLCGRVSGQFSVFSSIVNVVTIAQSLSQSSRPSSLLTLQSTHVFNRARLSNIPCTGGVNTFMFGQSLGGVAFSARHRFAGSASEATHWTSDSVIQLRTTGGIVIVNTTLVVSFPGQSSSITKALVSVLSYDTPSPSFATSHHLSNISITGSNFGVYLAVVPSTTSCTAILSPNAAANICNSSALDLRNAGVTVTEAAVSVSFSRPLRLDDISLSMLSPRGTEFKLLQNKCYGALPCPGDDVVSFHFQILPISQLQSVPLAMCPSSGRYVPDDVASLKLALLSQAAMGIWSLRVVTGSETQNVSIASIFFKTASLEFRIANVPVTSLAWVSDSSVFIKAPGYLDAEGIESSSGFGRNRTVSALSSGISSPSSCTYAYPDPAVTSAIISKMSCASGSTRMQLMGRYFSNSDSKPRIRAGLSSCATTQWLSDTALTCNQSPSLGSILNAVLSVERSAVADFSAPIALASAQSVLSNRSFVSAETGTSLVFVDGSGLGMWDSSVRVRHMRVMSAAAASAWLCETRMLARIFPYVSNRHGIAISLVLIVNNASAFKEPQLKTSTMTSLSRNNVPSTGSAVVVVSGAVFGLYSTSLKMAVSNTSCEGSRWTSHSSVSCKTSSGYSGHSNALPLLLTFSGVSASGDGLSMAFDVPAVNSSANLFSENSDVCFFNSSGCLAGKLVQLTRSSSGFGTCAFPNRQFILVQGSQSRSCDNSSWISDSSVHCLFSALISPEFRDFQVITESAAFQTLTITNPFYIPAPPPLSNSTLQFRFYRNVMYPQDDSRFIDFGTTSGFKWSDSSLALNVRYSEVVTFSFLVFLRASQFFMDAKFAAIETFISGYVTVWSTVDVTSRVLCDQSAFKNISLSLRPRSFWTKMTVSLTFCAPKDLDGLFLTLNADILVRNARGELRLLAISPLFRVNSAGTASISLTMHPSAQVAASSLYDDVLGFRFNYGTDLDDVCEQGGIGLFKYSIALICAGKVSPFRSQPRADTVFVESTQCLQNVSRISFVNSAKQCRFNVSALTDGIVFRISPEFDIIPGRAEVAVLVGTGPFCASAGAIVWSVNSSSDGLCLVAQLQDAEGNNITSAALATVVARAVHSSEPNYQVARSASNVSSASGLIRWCDAYSSKTQSAGVVFGARVNGNITYWTQGVINVSSTGVPSNLIPVGSAASSNVTLVPGGTPPKLSFSIEDAGGNSVTRSERIAVRVRIVPRMNATIGRSAAQISASTKTGTRSLLQSSNFSTDACDRGLPLEFVFFQSTSMAHIFAGPEFLCRAGVNDVYFDVGSFGGDVFSPIVSNAYTTSVSVIPGEFKYFSLVDFAATFSAPSFSLIDSLEIMFIDAGLNEVSGTDTMSLVCINASAVVFPAKPFTAVSNASHKAYAPPFFLYVEDWVPSESPFKIGLTTANSTVFQYGRNTAFVHLNHSCSPGRRLTLSSNANVYAQLIFRKSNMNTSVAGTHISFCAKCTNGTISSRFDAQTCRPCQAGTVPSEASTSCVLCDDNFYKPNDGDGVCRRCPIGSFASSLRDTCYTFAFASAPNAVIPDRAITVGGISIRNALGHGPEPSFFSMKVLIVLAKRPFSGPSSAVLSANATFSASTWIFPSIKLLRDQVNPASDFTWVLKMVEPAITDVYVTFDDVAVSVLDVLPTVHAFSPTDFPFSGSNISVDCVPSSPSTAFFLPLFTVTNVTNASCVFQPETAGLTSFSQPAQFSFVSRTLITLRCSSLSSGQLGPPHSVWRVRALFPDGRESLASTSIMTVHCPAGMYIEPNATISCAVPPCCTACPSPISSTSGINSIGIHTCICQPGHYGSGGLSCKQCPRNVKFGIVCTRAGLLLPLVKRGYYIDYSLLSKCSEDSCSAVVKCQNERACPGSGEKVCLTDADECYDSSAFGCIKCCKGFFMENFVCRRCPSAQLPLLFGLALLALILFVGISSSVDFPPILSVLSGMKVFMKGMQAFVGIRLFDIPWPSIVLNMFDFTRFFSFSIDVLRPECTFTYNEDTKLASILIGPFACIIFVAIMMILYVAFKCQRISRALEHPTLQPLLPWEFARVFKSVWSCIIASALCLKFTSAQMMRHGTLWNALNPTLIQRSDTLVLNQKLRRGAVAGGGGGLEASGYKKRDRLPREWTALRSAVSSFDFLDDFNQTTRRFRLMLSSAMSIFVFTFQGSMEAALSTFDCSDDILRKVPTVRCDISDSLYTRLVIISVIGIVIYCVVLPGCVALVLRSRWSRDTFIHENAAYNQLVGFLTSLYANRFHLWELVVCINKIVLISIPMFVTKNKVAQSLSTFIFMLIYMFFVVYLKPMQSSYLNKVEILSCVGVVAGAFTSVFFVVELDGAPLLSGSTKDLVGLVFVMICALAFSLSVKYIYQDFSRLFLMYRISFAKSWILNISTCLGAAGTEGAYIPLVATMFNKFASRDIFNLKSKLRIETTGRSEYERTNLGILSHCWRVLCAWIHEKRYSLKARQYQPAPDLLDKCMKEPELEALVYLHKLSERVASWERVSWKFLGVNKKHLPAEFREVKGDADPPLAEYAYQANVIHMLEDALPPSMHRVLTSLMFSHLMMMARTELTPAEREYNDRIQEKLQEFAVRMSSISQIYFHVLNTERRRHNSLPIWRRLFSRNTPKKDIFMRALARMSDLDISKLTADALGYSLPQFQQPAHQASQGDSKQACHELDAYANAAHAPPSKTGRISDSSADSALHIIDMSITSNCSPVTSNCSPVDNIDVTESPVKSRKTIDKAVTKSSEMTITNISKSMDGDQDHLPFESAKKSSESRFELQEVVVDYASAEAQSKGTQRGATCHPSSIDASVSSASETPSSIAADDVKTIGTLGALTLHRKGTAGSKFLTAAMRKPIAAAVVNDDTADECVGHNIIPQPPPRSRSCSRPMRPGAGEATASAMSGDSRNQESHAPAVDAVEDYRASSQVAAADSSLLRHLPSAVPQTRRYIVARAPPSELQNQVADLPPSPSEALRGSTATARAVHMQRSVDVAEDDAVERTGTQQQLRLQPSVSRQVTGTTAPLASTIADSAAQPRSRWSAPRTAADAAADSAGKVAPAESTSRSSAGGGAEALSWRAGAADGENTGTVVQVSRRLSKTDDRPPARRKEKVKSMMQGWQAKYGDRFEEC